MTRHIDHVDVSESVATGRMTLPHGTDTFTDLFLLVRMCQTWHISNEVYHHHGNSCRASRDIEDCGTSPMRTSEHRRQHRSRLHRLRSARRLLLLVEVTAVVVQLMRVEQAVQRCALLSPGR
jgi:Putative lumazine-binding